MAEARVPGVAVGVRVGAQEVAVGYGVTSVEDPLPVHARTLFQIGSVSKTFTAAAIMALAERGRLTLDDPVCRHLPTFRLPAPGHAERVTIRHLLTHAAGFVGDWFLTHPPGAGEGDDALARVVDGLAEVPQLFPPGDGWSYNNAGFAVAGRVVEALTGRPYAAALRELLLGPLGLDQTFVSADEAITHRTALPHTSTTRPPRVLRGAGWQPGWELARADVPPRGAHLERPGPPRVGAVPPRGRRAGAVGPRSRGETVAAMQEPLAPAGGNADHVGDRVDAPDGRWPALGGSRRAHDRLRDGVHASAPCRRGRRRPDERDARRCITRARRSRGWSCAKRSAWTTRPRHRIRAWPVTRTHSRAGTTTRSPSSASASGRERGELVLEHHARGAGARPVGSAGPLPLIRLAFYARDRVIALAPPRSGRPARGLRAGWFRPRSWLRWGGRLAPRLGD